MATYKQTFGILPVIGMLHTAGKDPVDRALKEIEIYESEGLHGVIVENYVGSSKDVKRTLDAIANRHYNIKIGVNILPNNFEEAFFLAHRYGAQFIQLDHVAGFYDNHGTIDVSAFTYVRNRYPDILVLGGVWPKYYTPAIGSDLATDLDEGRYRADAIVVTGEGTGIATPMEKITTFRHLLQDHPLMIGAGLTSQNAYEQLTLADGAIVGSAFKPDGDIRKVIDRNLVKEFMDVANRAKQYKVDIASQV